MLTSLLIVAQFIQNHYKEAAAAINSLQSELSQVCTELGIAGDQFEEYLLEEKKYLASLKAPSPITTLKTQYVQALNKLSQCR